MHLRNTARCAAIAVVALAPLWAPLSATAEDAKRPIPPNPIGAGGTWSQTVNKEAAIAGEEFDKKQVELIQKVATYFNQMKEIKGLFVRILLIARRYGRAEEQKENFFLTAHAGRGIV